MSKLSYQIIHAFATSPSSGNPAAVVLLPPARDVPQDADAQTLIALYPPDDVLQATAAEADQPMTAFALPLSPNLQSAKQSYALRWFNPITEAWLCGHATMATSAVLFAAQPQLEEVEYTTMKYGQIVARRGGKGGEGVEVSMDFPELTDLGPLEASEKERYLSVLGQAARGWDESAILDILDSPDRLLLELKPEFDLGKLEMDCKKLASVAPKTIVLTQVMPKEKGVKEQIRSRVFVIVPGFEHEDQVTGSAHCLIIPYFQTHSLAVDRFRAAPLADKDEKGNQVVRCRQVSPSGGDLLVTWRRKDGKVRITGRCIGMKTD